MKDLIGRLARGARGRWLVPAGARAEVQRDRAGLPPEDPGLRRTLPEVIAWICRAQDSSLTADGGVARDYSLIRGWASSYPETTGYIIPTMIEYAERSGQSELRGRARRMVDWLVTIQLPCGGFQAGKIDSVPVVPVTFNTGQVLLGLAAGQAAFGAYSEPLRRAADWLVDTQDPDGCWRRYPTPFAAPGEKSYETHTAWGLFEAHRLEPSRGYAEAALASVRWALGSQRENGWLENCCLDDPSQPLTHTIGYALRGVLEAYRSSRRSFFLDAARRTADGVLSVLEPDGRLPGRLLPDWSGAVKWVCLTGTAQIAHCWLMLYQETGENRYAEAAFTANAFVRRTVRLDGPPETRGGVKGSFPVDGAYGRYQYVNWAAKFLADSLIVEEDVRAGRLPLARLASGASRP